MLVSGRGVLVGEESVITYKSYKVRLIEDIVM